MLKFTQTTNGALSSFQYTWKANPTGNRENWGVGVDTGQGPTSRAEWEPTGHLNLNLGVWVPPPPTLNSGGVKGQHGDGRKRKWNSIRLSASLGHTPGSWARGCPNFPSPELCQPALLPHTRTAKGAL